MCTYIYHESIWRNAFRGFLFPVGVSIVNVSIGALLRVGNSWFLFMIEINLLPTTQYIWLRSRILMSILASVGCALLCLWTVHGWFIRAIHREQVYQASLFQALEEKRMQ